MERSSSMATRAVARATKRGGLKSTTIIGVCKKSTKRQILPHFAPSCMHKVPLSKVKIESKLAVMREALGALQNIATTCTETEFIGSNEKFAVAEHHLRRALEAVFDIGGHIFSRFAYGPGKRPKTLREIAGALGEKGIVEPSAAAAVAAIDHPETFDLTVED